ncbi:MAG TPA: VWA domain-containing protein [Terriglobales bacterium]|nr:VWA domain-containing protein [Terriglobales bacterium]
MIRNRKPSSMLALFAGMCLLFFVVNSAFTQSSGQQTIPDAPSASRPFPKPSVPSTSAPAPPDTPAEQPPSEPQEQSAEPAPPANITTVPAGGATREHASGREELFTLIKTVNFVQVPVTVKDDRGQLVAGLLPQDFMILENDDAQRITFFTSDPFPLSAAVVLDLGMTDVAVSRVRETLPALVGAFGQFDEVSLYTYGNTVQRVQGFTPAQNEVFLQTMRKLQKQATGRTMGAPMIGGPLGSGPTINGRPADPGAAATVNAPQSGDIYRPTSRVLNDAVLQAALELGQRDRTRRKVLFIISNGRELGSDASYSEVLKVLLTHQITVYAVGVEEASIPGYRQLNRIRIPGQGYGDILPKYAAATGGQVFREFTRDAIETAYAQVTQEARNQYTIGYLTRPSASSQYRSIEVRVRRPGLKVIARDGYYPLPPSAK